MTDTMTPKMREAFFTIKNAIDTMLRSEVEYAGARYNTPRHKVIMRTDTIALQPVEGDSDDVFVKWDMKNNPYVTLAFTPLARVAPTVITAERLAELMDNLVLMGFVPDDVDIHFSPYNLTGRSNAGALNLVVIFNSAVYGEEAASVEVAEPVYASNDPMSFLT